MASIVVNGDTSGAVTLSAPAVAGTVTVTLPSANGTMLTTASSTGISGSAISSGTVAEAYGGTGTSVGYYGFKNRIINGAMVIDQRNAGASVTADGSFPVDRWKIVLGGGGALTAQRSTTAPAGFINSLAFTVTTADTSLGTSDEYSARHAIEGFNVSDLGWGTAAAQPVTLSFKVRSSLTGTFGGVIRNSAANRVYVFSYTISAANTFEDKSITIAGDTSGTWLTDNGIGLQLIWSLGAGSARMSSAGSWGTDIAIQGVTGQTQWIGTSGATFYITGVQLEKGSTATSFDYRPYGTELGLCQRYAVVFNGADSNSANRIGFGIATSATKAYCLVNHPVTMRSKASLINSATINVSDASIGTATTSLAVQSVVSDTNHTGIDITVASGLTSFRSYFLEFNGTSGVFTLSAEL